MLKADLALDYVAQGGRLLIPQNALNAVIAEPIAGVGQRLHLTSALPDQPVQATARLCSQRPDGRAAGARPASNTNTPEVKPKPLTEIQQLGRAWRRINCRTFSPRRLGHMKPAPAEKSTVMLPLALRSRVGAAPCNIQEPTRACGGPGCARLRHAYLRPVRSHQGRGRRPRPDRLGQDRLGQDRGLRTGDRRATARGGSRAVDPRAARAGNRADPRAGDPGQPGAGLALRLGRRAGSPASAAWTR